ncbi:MAG: hypothetical protein P8Y71_10515 [Pseudolabrys sp.]
MNHASAPVTDEVSEPESRHLAPEHRRKELVRQIPMERDDGAGTRMDLAIAADQLNPEETLIEREAADVV